MLLMLLISGGFIHAQFAWDSISSDSVMYDKNFVFQEGIYITYKQFKEDRPSTRKDIITTVDPVNLEFYTKLVRSVSFQVLRENGKYINVFPEDIFGYTENGITYVNTASGFTRLVSIGAICYFPIQIEQTPTVQPALGVGMGTYGGGVGVGVNIGGGGNTTTEYIFKFKSGQASVLSPESLAEFIRDDEILYHSYVSMKKKEKKKQMHQFMREYNDRHQIYFPKHDSTSQQ